MAYRGTTITGGPVAVIGSGLAGITAAMRLADAGLRVVLFERNATLFSGASAVCEGKIHLGYTYVLDSSHTTTRRLLSGAARFRPILTRWIPEDGLGLSEKPFLYACPRDSMVPEDGVAAHLAHTQQEADTWGADLICKRDMRLRALNASELGGLFDTREISAAWETNELASSPSTKRPFLLSALGAQPLVDTRTEAEVTGISREDDHLVVTWGGDGLREKFGAVINASWEQRLRLDQYLNLSPPRQALHRFKCGLHLQSKDLAERTPNVTFVIGEYGDSVAAGDRVYVSWYRAGLLKSEVALAPDPAPVCIAPSTARRIAEQSIAALARYMPGYGNALAEYTNDFEVRGGYISAWGTSGIADPNSGLHSRAEIGVTSLPRYHSINTGKYVMAPKYGEEAALRVLSEMGLDA